MPTRPCLRCRRICATGSLCPACQAARWAEQGRSRGPRPWYSGKWRAISKKARALHPYCANCGSRDNLQADHVTPRSLSGGIRVLCPPCHARLGQRTPARRQ
jgi:5-methylcytosine-specific restriction endonuclease McrA